MYCTVLHYSIWFVLGSILRLRQKIFGAKRFWVAKTRIRNQVDEKLEFAPYGEISMFRNSTLPNFRRHLRTHLYKPVPTKLKKVWRTIGEGYFFSWRDRLILLFAGARALSMQTKIRLFPFREKEGKIAREWPLEKRKRENGCTSLNRDRSWHRSPP